MSLLLSYYVEVGNYELLLKELKKARKKPTGLGEGESGLTGTTKAWPVCFLLFSWKYLATRRSTLGISKLEELILWVLKWVEIFFQSNISDCDSEDGHVQVPK